MHRRPSARAGEGLPHTHKKKGASSPNTVYVTRVRARMSCARAGFLAASAVLSCAAWCGGGPHPFASASSSSVAVRSPVHGRRAVQAWLARAERAAAPGVGLARLRRSRETYRDLARQGRRPRTACACFCLLAPPGARGRGTGGGERVVVAVALVEQIAMPVGRPPLALVWDIACEDEADGDALLRTLVRRLRVQSTHLLAARWHAVLADGGAAAA